jgi:hypothetical protein
LPFALHNVPGTQRSATDLRVAGEEEGVRDPVRRLLRAMASRRWRECHHQPSRRSAAHTPAMSASSRSTAPVAKDQNATMAQDTIGKEDP